MFAYAMLPAASAAAPDVAQLDAERCVIYATAASRRRRCCCRRRRRRRRISLIIHTLVFS
jgi:hypothetical protein